MYYYGSSPTQFILWFWLYKIAKGGLVAVGFQKQASGLVGLVVRLHAV
jgi:hypothetical protein